MKTPIRYTIKQVLHYFHIDIETLNEHELSEWDSNIILATSLSENEILFLKSLTTPHYASIPTNDVITKLTLFNKGLLVSTLTLPPIYGAPLSPLGERILEILYCFNTLSIGILKHTSDNIPTPPIRRIKPMLLTNQLVIGKIYRNSLGQDLKVLNIAKQLIDGKACDVVIYSLNNQLPSWVAEYKEFVKDIVPMKEVSVGLLAGMELDKLVAELQDIPWSVAYKPTEDWAIAGPIIEQERIELWRSGDGWLSNSQEGIRMASVTALVSAMRTYVSSKLGSTVLIPDLG